MPHTQVDDGTKRFHQIIDQTHRIRLVCMMQRQRRVQPGTDHCPCRCRAQHGVAVVEERIDAPGVLVAAERLAASLARAMEERRVEALLLPRLVP